MVGRGIPKELWEPVANGAFLHCKHIHEGSCEREALVRLFRCLKLTSKFYLPVHLIPALIFQRKKLKENPK